MAFAKPGALGNVGKPSGARPLFNAKKTNRAREFSREPDSRLPQFKKRFCALVPENYNQRTPKQPHLLVTTLAHHL